VHPFGRSALAASDRGGQDPDMKHVASISLVMAALALGACGNGHGPENGNREILENRVAGGGADPPGRTMPQEEFGPEEAMAGPYVTRFEHADFNGCWLSMTADAAADFRRRFPPESADAPRLGRVYRLRIFGRRSIDPESGPPSYGHMGGWRCEIRAARIISAEVAGVQGAPRASDADRTGKSGSDAPRGLGAGHDRARLEELRRRAGQ